MIVIAGMLGVTRTGVAGAGTSLAPTTVLTTVAAHGAGGEMNLADLTAMKRLFDQREQPMERNWAITAAQVEDLFAITQVTSSDFNVQRVLAQGQMNSYMGFNWVRVEDPILPNNAAGTQRRTAIWTNEAVWLAIGTDITGSIDRRPDKNNSTQVFYSFDLGASRLDDLGVVEQEFTEL